MRSVFVFALVGAALAYDAAQEAILDHVRHHVIPPHAEKLKGKELTNYVNSVQNFFRVKEDPSKTRRPLMSHAHAKPSPNTVMLEADPFDSLTGLPLSFDARDNWPACKSIGYIRDQSQCGACWAFGAAEVMSDRYCIQTNGTLQPVISADDLLSCCSACGYGCDGGYPYDAFEYWTKTGIVTGGGYYEQEGCRPYEIEPCGTHVVNGVSHNHDCKGFNPKTPKCSKSCTTSYAKAYSNDKFYGKNSYGVYNDILQIQREIYKNGPVEAAFTVYEDFYDYTSGVYVHTAGEELGGHAVKIIGWGVENSVPYWLIANSWNNDWGENGFFRMIRGTNNCGIEEAIVAGQPKV